ncbi:hypothetical protein PF010_g4644 [Phytophthora fragariae]|uniref:Secreted protein n=1 Tax=Phytophthora fragariae TaxID=53985 RepID=A0A6G0LQL7_9STRA|nr:hypothetical protein PF010_g4644 [Phytophthora fragariae]KAE9247031.1 hypothetical protein PF004_g4517 [Phytophthora fragariae]
MITAFAFFFLPCNLSQFSIFLQSPKSFQQLVNFICFSQRLLRSPVPGPALSHPAAEYGGALADLAGDTLLPGLGRVS